ncbi:hypothetical protein EJ05DRAFT_476831 [Pseudovirgaria hyperparasitica]|uniref:Phosphoribosylaminoimidazole-succinocarboxamide synthase n=1 Tax=Pseudovirgaria hyperparasitica TaxID=470096 RepID=A0A6A6W3T4_9PEZI|nr:uncharacterized protein EJ05DRAFT_476831 [Pseudovirgaria hyperparasitica]KAF2757598.1 hypothetical protein EJ05DRAFT_476831 [Pseudovirgaria hyperparasitica]
MRTANRLPYIVVSQPQLYHSTSKQSITASEDYYSASEGTSSELSASNADRRRYSTPPLRRSPDADDQHSHAAAGFMTRPKNVTFDNSTTIHERPHSEDSYRTAPNTGAPRRQMASISPSTTPGLDDTPYIRFAIDQLTRDEEVRGSRHYQGVPEDSNASYPVDRVISDEGLGYFGGPPQQRAQQSQRPVSQPFPQPITQNIPQTQLPQRTISSDNAKSTPVVPGILPRLPSSGSATITRKSLPPAIAITAASDQTPPQSRRSFIPPPHGRTDSGQSSLSHQSLSGHESLSKDIFVPHRPTRESLRYPPLDFLPSILRPLSLVTFILLCTIMLAMLIFCAVYSLINNGLWAYGGFGGGRYFTFQYLPTIVGMMLLMWLFQVQTAVQRIAPFMALCSESHRSRSEAMFLRIAPMSFLLPNVNYFKTGQTVFGIFSAASWLFIFTIPLLGSAFGARHEGPSNIDGEWVWISVQGVIWATIALYVFLVLSLMLLVICLWRRQTGLKWDPRSLADIIALLERSNTVGAYEGAETFQTKTEFRDALADQAPLLGYWHTSKRQNDVFYGLGEPGYPTRKYSVEDGKIREKAPEKAYQSYQSYPKDDVEAGAGRSLRREGDFSIRMDIRSSKVRLHYLPWYLRDTFVAAWVVIAIVLLAAFLVISFINNAVRDGFAPLLGVESDSTGFSPANFLYSFVPGVIGTFLFLSWQSLDLSFRALTPYASLSSPRGATAEQSLLLDYSARLPISVTVVAAANGHFAVAVLSLFTLFNAAIPVLSGGVFWNQYYVDSRSVRVAAHLPAFYALCVFLALYAFFICVIFVSRKRMALPHASNNLAEIVSWVYQSPILADRAFARPTTKADLVTRLMGAGWTDKSTFSRSLVALVSPSRQNLAVQRSVGAASADLAPSPHGMDHDETDVDQTGVGEKRQSILDPGAIRYGFGIHVGRDGMEHLGIDRVKRGTGREMVIYEQTKRPWRD